MRAIAERTGWSHETVRRDINTYLAKLDAACLEGAASLRAELFEKYDAIIQALEHEVLGNGNLDRVSDLLKATTEVRRLYALDVQPLGRTELALRRTVITEIVTKLRHQLTPDAFAEVALLLTEDEPIHLLDGVAVEAADAEGAQPPRRHNPAQGSAHCPPTPAAKLHCQAEPIPPTALVDERDDL